MGFGMEFGVARACESAEVIVALVLGLSMSELYIAGIGRTGVDDGESTSVVFEKGTGWMNVVTGTGRYVVLVNVRVIRDLGDDELGVEVDGDAVSDKEEQGTSGPAPLRRQAVAVADGEDGSVMTMLEVSVAVLRDTGTMLDVALSTVTVDDATPDADVKTASRLDSKASCSCRRSLIALRNSKTSCGRSDKPSCMEVTVSISSAASVSGVELGMLCNEVVVASRRSISCL